MHPSLRPRPTDLPRIDKLVELALVLPAQKAVAAVSRVRAVGHMLQDFFWETAITSAEGVLVLGVFHLLVSFSLSMWVAPAVRQANIMLSIAVIMAATARYYSASRNFVFGPKAPATIPPRDIT